MRFDAAFDILMGHEGGYIWHPQDPGGETNWGISKKAYPLLDIKHLTRDKAKEIYRRDYWDKIAGDDLPFAVAFQVFDAAVNHGISKASTWLQEIVGVKADGVIGPKTIDSVVHSDNVQFLPFSYLEKRLFFYTSLSTFDDFGRGWTNRIAKNIGYAVESLI